MTTPVGWAPLGSSNKSRQIRNFSPTQFMCVGSSDGSFGAVGSCRVSDLAWAIAPETTSSDAAAYGLTRGIAPPAVGANDPFGYGTLSPTDKAGQPIGPVAAALVDSKGICMPPLTQMTFDAGSTAGGDKALVAFNAPINTATWDRTRLVDLYVDTSHSCVHNIGVKPTNQQGRFQAQGDQSVVPPIPAPELFYYGASDTPWSHSGGGDWQSYNSIIALAPGTGAMFWNEKNLGSSDLPFGDSNGSYNDDYGCVFA